MAAFVIRFYQICLKRDLDAAGLVSWTEKLRAKTLSGSDVAWGFIQSSEFISLGLNDSDYLEKLYQSFYNRTPDSAGKAAWQAILACKVLREDALYGFIYAQEFTNLCNADGIGQIDTLGQQRYQVRQFVRRFYQA